MAQFAMSGKSNVHKKRWAKKVGSYRHFCLILAGFDPVKAEQIYDNPAHVIAEAYVSKIVYEHRDVPKSLKSGKIR